MSMKDRLKRWGKRASDSAPAEVGRRIGQNDVMSLSAALAYYTLISMAPLITLLLWITTTLGPGSRERFFDQLNSWAGPQIENAARTVVENADQDPGAGSIAAVLGTIALIVGASIVFGHLQLALNRIFGTPSVKSKGVMAWLKKRLLSLGMVLTLGFLLVVSMVAQAGLDMLAEHFPAVLPVIVGLVALVMYTLVFAAIFHFVPDCPIDTRRSLIGGAMTAVMFIVGRYLIGLYLGRDSTASAYGSAGGIVIALIWMYYSAVVFFIGAVATSVLDDRARGDHRSGNEPRSDATEPGDGNDSKKDNDSRHDGDDNRARQA